MTRAARDGDHPARAVAVVASVALAAVLLLAVAPGSAAAAPDNGTNASFEYDGDRITVPASSDAEIRADTALPAGEVVTIRLRSTGGSPFLRSPQTTVGPDGRVVAPVDLSRVEPGSKFDAALLANGTTLATADGVVGACERGCEPTPTPDTETSDSTPSGAWLTQTVVMATVGDNARIPVAVPDDGPVTLWVTRGDYRLAATARDTNGDGRLTFRIDTGAVGTDAPTIFVGEGDTLTERTEHAPAGGLDSASYDVNVTDGVIGTGREVDVGTLALRACTTCPEPDGSTPGGIEAARTPDWPDDDSLLAVPTVTVQAGESARLPLNVEKRATVAIGSESQDYRLVATVRDADGDGRVALLFYPRNAGTAAPTVAVGGADSVSITRETDLAGPFPATTYDIAVRAGTETAGSPDDIGALDVLGVGANATTTSNGSAVREAGGSSTQGFTSGVGAIALGGVLAVVGIAVILGFGRS